jgi:hypothetical protein
MCIVHTPSALVFFCHIQKFLNTIGMDWWRFVGGTTPYSKYDEVELFDKATSSSYTYITQNDRKSTHKMGTHHTQNSHDYALPNVHTIMYLKGISTHTSYLGLY